MNANNATTETKQETAEHSPVMENPVVANLNREPLSYAAEPHIPADLVMVRDPKEVLAEAQKAAQALQEIMSRKSRSVMFNGEQYLEFEDWQTLAKFYGITVKSTDTQYVEFGPVKGFMAKAVALRLANGQEISGAEAMCLNDERNWGNKPLFQLKSMAQTRACAKALRNVLAWVVVLAGYKPTPAEEMTGMESSRPASGDSGIQHARPSEDNVVDDFLKLNEEYSQLYGPEAYKHFLHNSKGESPTIDRIRTFSSPKQLAWLRTALGAMERHLKESQH